MTPVSIVTGFLGSGKTTLIARCLRDPAFARTAVIVSEFGEVGLDHDLIAAADDTVLTLATGCLCCVVQTDLVRTLLDLWHRRAAGTVAFDRVLIETSGLSDPAPVLLGLIGDREVAARFEVPAVAALIDAVHGEAALRDHAQARHQTALADTVLFSKTDLCPVPQGLLGTLDGLNPGAARKPAADAAPADLFAAQGDLSARLSRTPRAVGHSGIDTHAIIREHPVPALALTLLLQALAEHCGPRLLRLKGLVAIQEMPGRPAVVHAVRHVASAPVFLPQWPSPDRRTRIVLITSGVPPRFAPRLLDAIEAEVRDAAA